MKQQKFILIFAVFKVNCIKFDKAKKYLLVIGVDIYGKKIHVHSK